MASISRKRGKRIIRWRCPVTGRNRSYQPKDQRLDNCRTLKKDIERACDAGIKWVHPSERAPAIPSLSQAIADVLTNRARRLKASTLQRVGITYLQLLQSLEEAHPGERITVQHLSRQALSNHFQWLLQPRPTEYTDPTTGRKHTRTRTCSPATATNRIRDLEDLWLRIHDHDEHGKHTPLPRRLRDLPIVKRQRRPAPSWAQMDQVIAVSRPGRQGRGRFGSEALYRQVVLQRFLGLRVDQVQRLRWTDLDWQGRTLTIRPELGKSQQESQGRIVPVSAHLITEMATWGTRTGEIVGRRSKATVNKSTRAAWRRAGVPPEIWDRVGDRKGQPTHAFRRGFITGLRSVGVDLTLIHYLVGHQDDDITDTYTYWAAMGEILRGVVDRIPPLTQEEADQVVPLTVRRGGAE
ncbi:MAG: site-specific integrase [Myxococcota bacterium]